MEYLNIIEALWPVYFPKIEFDPDDKLVTAIKLFVDFFNSDDGSHFIPSTCVSNERPPLFDVVTIADKITLPDFITTLCSRPKEVIGTLSIAYNIINQSRKYGSYNHNLQHSISTPILSSYNDSIKSSGPISIYLYNIKPYTPFTELKSETLGKLVSVIGYVVRVSPSHHLMMSALFLCSKCGNKVMCHFEDGIYSPPQMCATPKCYNRSLEIQRHKVNMTDIQRIKIQEIIIKHTYIPPSSNSSSSSSSNIDNYCTMYQGSSDFITQSDDDKINNSTQSDQRTSAHSHHTQHKRQRIGKNTLNHTYNSSISMNDHLWDDDDTDDNIDIDNNHIISNENTNTMNSNTTTNNNNNNNHTAESTRTASNDPRVPRTFECEVRGPMVNNCCKAGDMVNIIGIVKTTNADRQRASFGKELGVHHLYIDVHSVVPCDNYGNIDMSFIQNQSNKSMNHSIRVDNSIYGNTDITNMSTTINNNNNISGTNNNTKEFDIVTHTTNNNDNTSITTTSGTQYSSSDLDMIRYIAHHPQTFALLVASLCPDIYGHNLVKAGLLLGLLGGTENGPKKDNVRDNTTEQYQDDQEDDDEDEEEGDMTIRSNIHILVVGDPGLGKSQMLRAAANISSRAIFVTGHSASAAGLTASISRDTKLSGGDMVIEAGALVLADKGICCIDELDKIDCDYHALLEAMEQQSISLAKCGVVTTLKSRATLLAAANPVHGHYDKSKTVQENLKMPAALLSRFDLVFILVDRPEEDHDRLLSEHIMRNHMSRQIQSDSSTSTSCMSGNHSCHNNMRQNPRYSHNQPHPSQVLSTYDNDDNIDDTNMTLKQRLNKHIYRLINSPPILHIQHAPYIHKNDTNNDMDIWTSLTSTTTQSNNNSSTKYDFLNSSTGLLTIDALKKYIEYCKMYCHPVLTKPAAKILQKQYLTMRAEASLGSTLPVTTRHLESLIRLAQARAKVDLCEEVSAEHAQDVIQLLQESLLDAFTTEIGAIETRKNGTASLPKQIKGLVSAMKRESQLKGSDIFTKNDMQILHTKLKLSKELDQLIEILRTECYLLLKGSNTYKLQST